MRPNFFENFKSSGSYLQKLGGWQLIKMSAVFFKLSKNCSFFRRLLLVHILFNGRPSKQVLNRCFSIIQDGHFFDCSHIESTFPLSNTHTHIHNLKFVLHILHICYTYLLTENFNYWRTVWVLVKSSIFTRNQKFSLIRKAKLNITL